jgi:archaemetzincin
VTSAIHIINGLKSGSENLERLADRVEGIFGLATDILPSTLPIDRVFDQSRRQYNSTALLTLLVSQTSASDVKSILVVDVDLYIPVLTFVFGEAQLNGVAAVV